MNYIPRTLEHSLIKASQHFKVVLLQGLREIGKSSLLRHLSNNRKIVSLDDWKVLSLAQTGGDNFFQHYPTPMTIEEIQRCPGLCREIKCLVDRSETTEQVWLTSSQRFDLIGNVTESLAGRMAIFELLPLSLYERQGKAFEQKPYLPNGSLPNSILDRKELGDIWSLIWQGAYPDIIGMSESEHHEFFNHLLHTYIEHDVQHAGVSKLNEFLRFLGILATRIGQELQIGKIAAQANIATQTARQWLSIAEASGVIYLLPAFSENIGKVLIKKPKIYFSDTGLASWVCEIASPQTLQESHLKERLFQNFVIMELRKSWIHNGKRADFYFYRDSNFKEIDLLIKNGNVYHPIAISTAESLEPSLIKTFNSINRGNVVTGPGSVICLTDEPHFIRSDVVAHSIFDI